MILRAVYYSYHIEDPTNNPTGLLKVGNVTNSRKKKPTFMWYSNDTFHYMFFELNLLRSLLKKSLRERLGSPGSRSVLLAIRTPTMPRMGLDVIGRVFTHPHRP